MRKERKNLYMTGTNHVSLLRLQVQILTRFEKSMILGVIDVLFVESRFLFQISLSGGGDN